MNICATAKPEPVFAFVHAGCWIAPFPRDRVSEVCQAGGFLLAFAAFAGGALCAFRRPRR